MLKSIPRHLSSPETTEWFVSAYDLMRRVKGLTLTVDLGLDSLSLLWLVPTLSSDLKEFRKVLNVAHPASFLVLGFSALRTCPMSVSTTWPAEEQVGTLALSHQVTESTFTSTGIKGMRQPPLPGQFLKPPVFHALWRQELLFSEAACTALFTGDAVSNVLRDCGKSHTVSIRGPAWADFGLLRGRGRSWSPDPLSGEEWPCPENTKQGDLFLPWANQWWDGLG